MTAFELVFSSITLLPSMSQHDSSPSDNAFIAAFQTLRIHHRDKLDALLACHACEASDLESSCRRSLCIAAQCSTPSSSARPQNSPPRTPSPPPAQPLSRSGVCLQPNDVVELCTPGTNSGIGNQARIIARTCSPTPQFTIHLLRSRQQTTRNAENLELISRP